MMIFSAMLMVIDFNNSNLKIPNLAGTMKMISTSCQTFCTEFMNPQPMTMLSPNLSSCFCSLKLISTACQSFQSTSFNSEFSTFLQPLALTMLSPNLSTCCCFSSMQLISSDFSTFLQPQAMKMNQISCDCLKLFATYMTSYQQEILMGTETNCNFDLDLQLYANISNICLKYV